ncbi:MAG: zinc-ribbon domain-containing protein [Candidatus Hydrogenedentes bacterium]|nr:zinc-ribbon domain-containing protein [Candidatus Hydrogenedentota bacterium]
MGKVAYVGIQLFIIVVVGLLAIPFLSRTRCPHCGSYNSLDAERCSKCGEKLSA